MEVVVVVMNYFVWMDLLNMGFWLVLGEEGWEGGVCYLFYELFDFEYWGF